MTDRSAGARGALTRLRAAVHRLRSALPRYFKKGDIIIIAALITLSLALGVAAVVTSVREADGGARTYAVITRGGEEIARLPLNSDTEYIISDSDAINVSAAISVSAAYNVIVVSGGRVYMSEANCPDRVCVSDGAISRPGQYIVCLPNRVVVTIESEDGAEIDSVAY